LLNKSDVTLLSDAFLMLYFFFCTVFSILFCVYFVFEKCVVATFTCSVGGVGCSPKVCWSRISTFPYEEWKK